MKFGITGVNHKTAPVAIREQLAIDKAHLAEAIHSLKQSPGLVEGLILSTCNRVEVAVTTEEDSDPQQVAEYFLAGAQKIADCNHMRPYIYGYEGREAIRHMFRVASSLDSMVVGEPQILGQLKAAYSTAKSMGAVSGFLDTVITRAFSVAKRVRTETEIGANAVSVSYAAVELAREIFGSLAGKRVLLIGAGKMSELAARHLFRSGASNILVTNRTRSRAEEVAALVRGEIVEYSRFQEVLPEADIVITSSGAPEYVLRREDLRRAIEARRNKPMFLIDIAVPRNIEPAVNELDNVFLYDVDDLQRVVDQNLKARITEAAQADKIVTEELDRLETWLRAKQIVPVIVDLQAQLEALRIAEVDRMRGKLGALSPQQEEAIESITRGIINKIAHGPITELRKNAGAPGSQMIEAIQRIFRLRK